MKTFKVLICFVAALAFQGCSLKNDDKELDRTLLSLLKSKDYFKLRSELFQNLEKLPVEKQLYYKTYIAQAFNSGSESNEYADILLKEHEHQISDSVKAELLVIKANNYIHSYQYAKASELYSVLLNDYKSVSDSAEIADFQNVKSLFGTLAEVAPQTMCLKSDVTIPAYRNKFNHLMIPVKLGGIADEFIFDTGANISTISESSAVKLGCRIFESDVEVGTSTDIKLRTKLAVSDSVYVGEILFKNVIFLVVPDSQMNFPSINYEIHGIVGYPVISQMGEVRMRKDGTIFVPVSPQDLKLNNVFMEGLNPVVQFISNADTLLLTLDTGAKTSELSCKYYNNHKAFVEQNGKLQTSQRGGGGGFVESEEYIISNFAYKIGTKSNVLPSISVLTTELDFNKNFDGNLGQDVFMQFDEMILNFKYMYVDFK